MATIKLNTPSCHEQWTARWDLPISNGPREQLDVCVELEFVQRSSSVIPSCYNLECVGRYRGRFPDCSELILEQGVGFGCVCIQFYSDICWYYFHISFVIIIVCLSLLLHIFIIIVVYLYHHHRISSPLSLYILFVITVYSYHYQYIFISSSLYVLIIIITMFLPLSLYLLTISIIRP